MLKIDKSVPPPPVHGGPHSGLSEAVFRQVPWDRMQSGDSVLLPRPEHLTPRQWQMQCNNRAHFELGTGNYRCRIDRESGDVRVWLK